MPLYEFHCGQCGAFSEFRAMADRDRPSRCPECSNWARRVVVAPNLALMSPTRRNAHAVNERSQHAPAVSTRHACSAGCGCGKGAKATAAPRRSKGPRRPWMLGH